MHNNERIESIQVAVKSAMRGNNAQIWTSLPGILQSIDLEKMTCSVQPSIKVQVFDRTSQKWSAQNLPLCVDVPVQFIGGGGYTATFPMAQGDEGLISFACRCIDSWWQSGGVQPQAELRMHDLSDGFFIPGFRSQARKLANISADSAQLRSDDGTNYVDVNKSTGTVTMKAVTKVVLDAPTTIVKGALVAEGVVSQAEGGGGTVDFGTATVKANQAVISGKTFTTHVHTNVATGTTNSGPPL